MQVPIMSRPFHRTEMEQQVSQLTARRDELTEELEKVEAVKKDLAEQLQDYTEETSQQVSWLGEGGTVGAGRG